MSNIPDQVCSLLRTLMNMQLFSYNISSLAHDGWASNSIEIKNID